MSEFTCDVLVRSAAEALGYDAEDFWVAEGDGPAELGVDWHLS